MRNTVAKTWDMLLLVVLFASLLVIYTLQPQNMPLIIGTAIFFISAVLVFSGQPWVPILLGSITTLFAVWAAWLMISSGAQGNGGLLATVVLVIVVIGAVAYYLLWKNPIGTRDGVVKVVFDEFDNPISFVDHGNSPLLSFPSRLNHAVAEVPVYDMTTIVKIEDINMPARHNAKRTIMRVHYDIKDVAQIFKALPNRSGTWEKIANDMKLPVQEARKTPMFWERLFDHQIQQDVESQLRDFIHYEVRYQTVTAADGTQSQQVRLFNAQDLYNERGVIAQKLLNRVQAVGQRWGANIKWLTIETVDVDPDVSKRINKDPAKELKEAKHTAEIEALRLNTMGEARAEFQAQFIAKLIAALKKENIAVDAKTIEHLMVQSMHEATTQGHRTDSLLATLLMSAAAQQENRKN